MRAEALVTQALEEREEIARQALEEAKLAEERLEARLPEIRESFMEKARQRVEQSKAELDLRYQERSRRLSELAQEAHDEAVEAVLAILLDPELR
ncbi:MAG TPA: ATPase [Chromatiaceae bacterium]|nr:ATPase [Chromatiaceae bacterium]